MIKNCVLASLILGLLMFIGFQAKEICPDATTKSTGRFFCEK